MASSVSGQDEPNACCDWLPERARWSHLARSGLPAASRKQNFTKSHIINPLLTKFVRSRWLDWRRSFLASLWTSTLSRSINTQKRTWPISSHLDRTNLVNNPYKWYLSKHGNYGKIYYTMITTTQFIWPQEHWLGAHIRNIQPTTFSICQFIFQLQVDKCFTYRPT